jgi:hypothetical protein
MKYESWLPYPKMTIAIHKMGDKYQCIEFPVNMTMRKSTKICESIMELKFFLLSIPNAPKKEVALLINSLYRKYKQDYLSELNEKL